MAKATLFWVWFDAAHLPPVATPIIVEAVFLRACSLLFPRNSDWPVPMEE